MFIDSDVIIGNMKSLTYIKRGLLLMAFSFINIGEKYYSRVKKMARDLFGLPKKPIIKPIDLWGTTSTPKKRSSCPKSVKESVWAKYCGINKMIGKCYVCSKPIHFTDFEVGHNKAFAKGGKWNINNLRPICKSCNRSMGTMTIESFKRKYFSKKRVVKKKKTARKKKAYYIDPLTGRKVPVSRSPWGF